MAVKTSITQIPEANDKIAREVAMIMKADIKDVRKIAKFLGTYIASTIERGQMEAVMLPYFGKFKPKGNIKIQEKIISHERSGFSMVYEALKGKTVTDRRDKTNLDKPRKIKPPKNKNL